MGPLEAQQTAADMIARRRAAGGRDGREPLPPHTPADETRDVLPWHVAARMVARGAAMLTADGIRTERGEYVGQRGPDGGVATYRRRVDG